MPAVGATVVGWTPASIAWNAIPGRAIDVR
jgi:hypothetical protein